MSQYTIIDGVAYPIADSAVPSEPATAAPAAARPTFGRVASPFATAASAKPLTIAGEALRLYPADRRNAKRYVALSMLPGWTCDVDATVEVDGTPTPTALHGFLTEHESGESCPGAFGVKRGESCPGKVR